MVRHVSISMGENHNAMHGMSECPVYMCVLVRYQHWFLCMRDGNCDFHIVAGALVPFGIKRLTFGGHTRATRP